LLSLVNITKDMETERTRKSKYLFEVIMDVD